MNLDIDFSISCKSFVHYGLIVGSVYSLIDRMILETLCVCVSIYIYIYIYRECGMWDMNWSMINFKRGFEGGWLLSRRCYKTKLVIVGSWKSTVLFFLLLLSWHYNMKYLLILRITNFHKKDKVISHSNFMT